MKHVWRVFQVIGKLTKNQKHGKVCTKNIQSADNLKEEVSVIYLELGRVPPKLKKQILKYAYESFNSGGNEKHGKLGTDCPSSLKSRQIPQVWIKGNSSRMEYPGIL